MNLFSLKKFIKFYNENFDIFQNGKYYRLSDPRNDDYAIFEYVYENKVIVGLMRIKTHVFNPHTPIRLEGLDENYVYTEKQSGEQYYGAQLMQYGLQLPASAQTGDYYSYMWILE